MYGVRECSNFILLHVTVQFSQYHLFIYLFIYLFLATLGLHFCARAFSSCGEWRPLFIVVHGPLTVAASLVAEHKLQTRRLSSCGSRAQLLRGMWDLPRPRLEPMSPSLAGRFSTTVPPGKPPPPAPLIEEAVFSPLYILASFLKDKVTICTWIYLWSFYPVP